MHAILNDTLLNEAYYEYVHEQISIVFKDELDEWYASLDNIMHDLQNNNKDYKYIVVNEQPYQRVYKDKERYFIDKEKIYDVNNQDTIELSEYERFIISSYHYNNIHEIEDILGNDNTVLQSFHQQISWRKRAMLNNILTKAEYISWTRRNFLQMKKVYEYYHYKQKNIYPYKHIPYKVLHTLQVSIIEYEQIYTKLNYLQKTFNNKIQYDKHVAAHQLNIQNSISAFRTKYMNDEKRLIIHDNTGVIEYNYCHISSLKVKPLMIFIGPYTEVTIYAKRNYLQPIKSLVNYHQHKYLTLSKLQLISLGIDTIYSIKICPLSYPWTYKEMKVVYDDQNVHTVTVNNTLNLNKSLNILDAPLSVVSLTIPKHSLIRLYDTDTFINQLSEFSNPSADYKHITTDVNNVKSIIILCINQCDDSVILSDDMQVVFNEPFINNIDNNLDTYPEYILNYDFPGNYVIDVFDTYDSNTIIQQIASYKNEDNHITIKFGLFKMLTSIQSITLPSNSGIILYSAYDFKNQIYEQYNDTNVSAEFTIGIQALAIIFVYHSSIVHIVNIVNDVMASTDNSVQMINAIKNTINISYLSNISSHELFPYSNISNVVNDIANYNSVLTNHTVIKIAYLDGTETLNVITIPTLCSIFIINVNNSVSEYINESSTSITQNINISNIIIIILINDTEITTATNKLRNILTTAMINSITYIDWFLKIDENFTQNATVDFFTLYDSNIFTQEITNFSSNDNLITFRYAFFNSLNLTSSFYLPINSGIVLIHSNYSVTSYTNASSEPKLIQNINDIRYVIFMYNNNVIEIKSTINHIAQKLYLVNRLYKKNNNEYEPTKISHIVNFIDKLDLTSEDNMELFDDDENVIDTIHNYVNVSNKTIYKLGIFSIQQTITVISLPPRSSIILFSDYFLTKITEIINEYSYVSDYTINLYNVHSILFICQKNLQRISYISSILTNNIIDACTTSVQSEHDIISLVSNTSLAIDKNVSLFYLESVNVGIFVNKVNNYINEHNNLVFVFGFFKEAVSITDIVLPDNCSIIYIEEDRLITKHIYNEANPYTTINHIKNVIFISHNDSTQIDIVTNDVYKTVSINFTPLELITTIQNIYPDAEIELFKLDHSINLDIANHQNTFINAVDVKIAFFENTTTLSNLIIPINTSLVMLNSFDENIFITHIYNESLAPKTINDNITNIKCLILASKVNEASIDNVTYFLYNYFMYTFQSITANDIYNHALYYFTTELSKLPQNMYIYNIYPFYINPNDMLFITDIESFTNVTDKVVIQYAFFESPTNLPEFMLPTNCSIVYVQTEQVVEVVNNTSDSKLSKSKNSVRCIIFISNNSYNDLHYISNIVYQKIATIAFADNVMPLDLINVLTSVFTPQNSILKLFFPNMNDITSRISWYSNKNLETTDIQITCFDKIILCEKLTLVRHSAIIYIDNNNLLQMLINSTNVEQDYTNLYIFAIVTIHINIFNIKQLILDQNNQIPLYNNQHIAYGYGIHKRFMPVKYYSYESSHQKHDILVDIELPTNSKLAIFTNDDYSGYYNTITNESSTNMYTRNNLTQIRLQTETSNVQIDVGLEKDYVDFEFLECILPPRTRIYFTHLDNQVFQYVNDSYLNLSLPAQKQIYRINSENLDTVDESIFIIYNNNVIKNVSSFDSVSVPPYNSILIVYNDKTTFAFDNNHASAEHIGDTINTNIISLIVINPFDFLEIDNVKKQINEEILDITSFSVMQIPPRTKIKITFSDSNLYEYTNDAFDVHILEKMSNIINIISEKIDTVSLKTNNILESFDIGHLILVDHFDELFLPPRTYIIIVYNDNNNYDYSNISNDTIIINNNIDKTNIAYITTKKLDICTITQDDGIVSNYVVSQSINNISSFVSCSLPIGSKIIIEYTSGIKQEFTKAVYSKSDIRSIHTEFINPFAISMKLDTFNANSNLTWFSECKLPSQQQITIQYNNGLNNFIYHNTSNTENMLQYHENISSITITNIPRIIEFVTDIQRHNIGTSIDNIPSFITCFLPPRTKIEIKYNDSTMYQYQNEKYEFDEIHNHSDIVSITSTRIDIVSRVKYMLIESFIYVPIHTPIFTDIIKFYINNFSKIDVYDYLVGNYPINHYQINAINLPARCAFRLLNVSNQIVYEYNNTEFTSILLSDVRKQIADSNFVLESITRFESNFIPVSASISYNNNLDIIKLGDIYNLNIPTNINKVSLPGNTYIRLYDSSNVLVIKLYNDSNNTKEYVINDVHVQYAELLSTQYFNWYNVLMKFEDVVSIKRQMYTSPVSLQLEQLQWDLSDDFARLQKNFVPQVSPLSPFDVNENKPFAWKSYLGHNIIQQCAIIIGNKNIQQFNGEWLDVIYQNKLPRGLKKSYDQMIGHIPSLYTLSTETKPAHIIRIPLPFWFHGFSKCNVLPIIALSNTVVTLRITLNHPKDCIINYSSNIDVNSVWNCKLLQNFIFLDNSERKNFIHNKLTYLIPQLAWFRFYDTSDINEDNNEQRYRLAIKGLVSGFIFNSPHSEIEYIYLRANGINLTPKLSGAHMNQLTAYQKYPNYSKDLYYISFALYPTELHQPSGHVNFSILNDINMFVKMKQVNSPFTMFVESYNLLHMIAGQADLLVK